VQGWEPYVAGGLDAGLAVGMLLWGFRSLWRKRVIENVPTSKVAGVFLGLTEVKGKAELAAPLTTWLAETAAVWYEWTVAEEWERWETETVRDSQGREETRTVRRSGWTTVAAGGETPPFLLRDETGALRIVPERAEIEADTVFTRTVGRSDPLYYAKGPAHAVADSCHRRSFTERAIRAGADLYVIGTARERKDAVEAEIGYEPDQEMFLISVRGEEAVRREYARGAAAKLTVGLLAATALPIIFFGVRSRDAGRALREEWPLAAAVGAAYGAALLLDYLRLLYNGLVGVRNRVKNAWSQIDIQLKRRFDLVPQLVATVKGYAAHEASLDARLAEIRAAGAAGARRGAAVPDAGLALAAAAFANGQTSALRGVIGVAEAYPALKADQNFARLMDELSKTEQRIALARTFFNESVTAYNDRLGTMPDALLARLGRMEPAAYFEIEAFERRPVDVKIAP
jgi:hypothetical protein